MNVKIPEFNVTIASGSVSGSASGSASGGASASGSASGSGSGSANGSVVQLEGVLCVCICMFDHVLPYPSMGPGNSSPIVLTASYNVL